MGLVTPTIAASSTCTFKASYSLCRDGITSMSLSTRLFIPFFLSSPSSIRLPLTSSISSINTNSRELIFFSITTSHLIKVDKRALTPVIFSSSWLVLKPSPSSLWTLPRTGRLEEEYLTLLLSHSFVVSF